MKISLGKKVTLGIMVFIYGMAMIAINLGDNLKVTRGELTRFYEIKLDSCVIQRLDTLKYPSRGTYRIFYTDCSADFYPIFLQNDDGQDFKPNSVISKEANSVDLKLWDNDKYYDLKIRHPDTEDDRGFGTRVALIFIGIATMLILLTPNSRFKRMEEG